MEKNTQTPSNNVGRPMPLLVWDLPTRLFHWLLVILVVISFITGKTGGNAMQYHEWSGFTILALLVFRVAWGLVGSRWSRFTNFVRGPAAVWHYAVTLVRGNSMPYPGHNPLGGWSILAMLMALFIQTGTGLFANDDIMTQGPLYYWVSKPTSDWLTGIHKLNQNVIGVLVAIHLLAILFHLLIKRENLVGPMLTGVKHWEGDTIEPAADRRWYAAVIAVLAAGAVFVLVR
jgi:cytochrome b